MASSRLLPQRTQLGSERSTKRVRFSDKNDKTGTVTVRVIEVPRSAPLLSAGFRTNRGPEVVEFEMDSDPSFLTPRPGDLEVSTSLVLRNAVSGDDPAESREPEPGDGDSKQSAVKSCIRSSRSPFERPALFRIHRKRESPLLGVHFVKEMMGNLPARPSSQNFPIPVATSTTKVSLRRPLRQSSARAHGEGHKFWFDEDVVPQRQRKFQLTAESLPVSASQAEVLYYNLNYRTTDWLVANGINTSRNTLDVRPLF